MDHDIGISMFRIPVRQMKIPLFFRRIAAGKNSGIGISFDPGMRRNQQSPGDSVIATGNHHGTRSAVQRLLNCIGIISCTIADCMKFSDIHSVHLDPPFIFVLIFRKYSIHSPAVKPKNNRLANLPKIFQSFSILLKIE